MNVRILFLLMSLLLALSACTAPATTTPGAAESAPSAEATGEPAPLRIVTSFAIDSMNPVEDGFWMPEFGVAEMLMQFRSDGQFHPWLLESLENTDELTWVLTLREGLTFQNGKPVDAAAVLATINRQMELSASAQGSIPADATFAATGDLEITVTTTEPYPALPGALSHEAIFPIYDAEAVDAVGDDWAQLVGQGIYTGPYAVESLDEQEMVATRYEGYWQGTPALPGVSVRFVTDPSARLLAVQNDEADIALYPPTAAKPVVDQTPGIYFNHDTPGTGGFMMYLNLQEPPFDDLLVRQAIIKAVDYEQIANEVFGGVFGVATSWYAPIFPWAINNQATDLDAANALFDEAGWVVGSDGVRAKDGQPFKIVMLIYPQQPDLVPMSNALQSQLRQLGIEVEIQSVDSINDAILEGTIAWNAALISNSTTSWGSPEPTLRRYYLATGDRNYGGFYNAEFEELANELFITIDDTRRNEILARIQEIIIEEEPYAFNLNFSNSRVIVNERYRGYQPGFSLYHVSWETQPAE